MKFAVAPQAHAVTITCAIGGWRIRPRAWCLARLRTVSASFHREMLNQHCDAHSAQVEEFLLNSDFD
jgi:hypothetical protein